MPEKYKPSEEKINKAEEMMNEAKELGSGDQKKMSEKRVKDILKKNKRKSSF